MENYSTVTFLVKHGNCVAIALSALPIVISFGLVFAGYHWLFAAAGLAAAAIAYLFLKSYVEIVRIIADVLLPK
jgi:hypothetical protein